MSSCRLAPFGVWDVHRCICINAVGLDHGQVGRVGSDVGGPPLWVTMRIGWLPWPTSDKRRVQKVGDDSLSVSSVCGQCFSVQRRMCRTRWSVLVCTGKTVKPTVARG